MLHQDLWSAAEGRVMLFFFLSPVIAREKKKDQKSNISLVKTKTAEGEGVS